MGRFSDWLDARIGRDNVFKLTLGLMLVVFISLVGGVVPMLIFGQSWLTAKSDPHVCATNYYEMHPQAVITETLVVGTQSMGAAPQSYPVMFHITNDLTDWKDHTDLTSEAVVVLPAGSEDMDFSRNGPYGWRIEYTHEGGRREFGFNAINWTACNLEVPVSRLELVTE